MTSVTQDEWDTLRAERFKAWRADHSDIDARLGWAKAETAALAARRGAERAGRWAAMCAEYATRSARLSDAETARAGQRVREAGELARASDWKGAGGLYAAVLETDPANVDAHFGLAQALRAQDDLAGAALHMSLAASFPKPGAGHGYFNCMMAMQRLPVPEDPALREPPVIFRLDGAPGELWDAPTAPVMTVIPGGEYTMGSFEGEANRPDGETPHRVTLAYPLAVSTADVTRGEFAAFVAATGHDAETGGCQIFRNGAFQMDPEGCWRRPGFEQTNDEAVTCVSYHDGVAYAEWLSKTTGHSYRLPSEAEWEYAVRGGTTTSYYWGEEIGLGHANCDGCSAGEPCLKPLPGGAFSPNPFGLYDVVGNVWKWLADAWNPDYVGAPSDGSAWLEGVTVLRGRRGGSWFNISEHRAGDVRAPFRLRSAARFGSLPDLRYSSFGMRVVRDV